MAGRKSSLAVWRRAPGDSGRSPGAAGYATGAAGWLILYVTSRVRLALALIHAASWTALLDGFAGVAPGLGAYLTAPLPRLWRGRRPDRYLEAPIPYTASADPRSHLQGVATGV